MSSVGNRCVCLVCAGALLLALLQTILLQVALLPEAYAEQIGSGATGVYISVAPEDAADDPEEQAESPDEALKTATTTESPDETSKLAATTQKADSLPLTGDGFASIALAWWGAALLASGFIVLVARTRVVRRE